MSNIDGKLHFSPEYTFKDFKKALDTADKDSLIKAFKDRICGFYIQPAKELNCLDKDKYAFAVGVLCVSTIDCLACITCRPRIPCEPRKVGERFERWLRKNIIEFDKPNPADSKKTLAYRFYYEFRNGLVHEGRIKNKGEFSNVCKDLVDTSEGIMLINAEILLTKINHIFEKYMTDIEKEIDDKEFGKLREYLTNLNN